MMRAVALVAPPSPVVDPDHGRRDEAWAAAPPHDPQQRVVAHRQHEPAREARRRPSAERQPEVMDDVVEPRRSPRPGRQHVGVEALGENAPPAQDGVAVEPSDHDHQANRPPRHRQIRQAPAIAAVDPLGAILPQPGQALAGSRSGR